MAIVFHAGCCDASCAVNTRVVVRSSAVAFYAQCVLVGNTFAVDELGTIRISFDFMWFDCGREPSAWYSGGKTLKGVWYMAKGCKLQLEVDKSTKVAKLQHCLCHTD
jgi:hypothetical protein